VASGRGRRGAARAARIHVYDPRSLRTVFAATLMRVRARAAAGREVLRQVLISELVMHSVTEPYLLLRAQPEREASHELEVESVGGTASENLRLMVVVAGSCAGRRLR
jgi:hypothetical protein